MPVILNPLQDLPDDFDQLGSRLDNAARSAAAPACGSLSRAATTHNARTDPPARRQCRGARFALGCGARRHHRESGARYSASGGRADASRPAQVADLVLWDGDPLEVTTVADSGMDRRARRSKCARARRSCATGISGRIRQESSLGGGGLVHHAMTRHGKGSISPTRMGGCRSRRCFFFTLGGNP